MNVQNIVPIYLVDVEIFHRIGENFDILVPLEEKSGWPKSVWSIPREPWRSVLNFMTAFQWTAEAYLSVHRPTDIEINIHTQTVMSPKSIGLFLSSDKRNSFLNSLLEPNSAVTHTVTEAVSEHCLNDRALCSFSHLTTAVSNWLHISAPGKSQSRPFPPPLSTLLCSSSRHLLVTKEL